MKDSTQDIARLQRQLGYYRSNSDFLSSLLRSGSVLFHPQIRAACGFVSRILDTADFVESLTHLERSYSLFRLFDHKHYRDERRAESAYLRENKYLEGRTLYDLAFLSAFRALEALLGTVQIHNHKIGERLRVLDNKFKTSFSSTRWESHHEVFSSGRKKWRFDELISKYLDLRNAVAAHANPRAPLLLREDQVLEIQLLVKSMLYDAAGRPPMPEGCPKWTSLPRA